MQKKQRQAVNHKTNSSPLDVDLKKIENKNLIFPPIRLRTSRPWRSNSLTPPATDQHLSASPTDHWSQYQNKGRSHSLTYVRDSSSNPESNQISPASSVSMIEEKEVEEIVKTLPEGCGMKGI